MNANIIRSINEAAKSGVKDQVDTKTPKSNRTERYFVEVTDDKGKVYVVKYYF